MHILHIITKYFVSYKIHRAFCYGNAFRNKDNRIIKTVIG